MATSNPKNTSASKAEDAPKAEYEVLSRLDHDGETYLPGSTVQLTDAQAAPLIGGAIKAK